MLHSPDELRLVIQHVQLDPGRAAPHRPRVRLHPPGRPPRHDVASRRGHADRRHPVRRQPAHRAREPVHALPARRARDRPRRRVRPPQGHRQRAGVGQAAGVHARAGARTDLRVGRHAARVAAPRVPAPARAHRDHPRARATPSPGIVTLEDLLEEVVGEIQDEQDAEEIPPIVRNADGSYEVDGRLTLDVAAREIGVAFPAVPPQVETLGGFVITQLPQSAGPGRRRSPRAASASRSWPCATGASAACTRCGCRRGHGAEAERSRRHLEG